LGEFLFHCCNLINMTRHATNIIQSKIHSDKIYIPRDVQERIGIKSGDLVNLILDYNGKSRKWDLKIVKKYNAGMLRNVAFRNGVDE